MNVTNDKYIIVLLVIDIYVNNFRPRIPLNNKRSAYIHTYMHLEARVQRHDTMPR